MPLAGTRKKLYTLEQRRAKNAEVRPSHVPVILERAASNSGIDVDLKQNRFQVEVGTTVGDFMAQIRARMSLSPETALFLLLDNGELVTTSALIQTLWQEHKDEDGALYMVYAPENTFG